MILSIKRTQFMSISFSRTFMTLYKTGYNKRIYKYYKNKVQKTFSEVAQELLENMPQMISELLESSGVSKQEIDYMLIKHKQHISNGFAKGKAIYGKGIDHDLEKPQEKPTSKTSNKNDNLAIIEVIMRKKNLSKAEALEYAIDNGLME